MEHKVKKKRMFSAEERKKLLRYHSDLNEEQCIAVSERQTQLIRYYRNQGIRYSADVSLLCLLHALNDHKRSTDAINRKQPSLSDLDILQRRIESFRRETREGEKERKFRLEYQTIVSDLRESGLGWRDCAAYLKKFHRFEISHQRLWKLHQKYSKDVVASGA